MSSRSEIERQRETYTRQSDRLAAERLENMQGPLWVIIGGLLDSLLTDDRGRILFNVRNITTASRVATAVQTYNATRGFLFLRWAFSRLTRLLRLNTEYFGAIEGLTPETVEDRVRRLIMLRYGYNPDTGTIDPNGYLAANVRGSGQAQVVAQRINQAIAGRENLRDFKQQFRGAFNSPGSPLSLSYHYNRFARDLFQEFDREVQLQYAEELGLGHAVYSGTIKNNTRCFCKRRVNKIYTREFMEAWNGQQWQGKKPGVSVLIALGGFNCRHVLSWMTDEAAQMVAARRKIKINSYNQVLC